MTKKLMPVEYHKERDIRLIRKKLLEIIESDTAKAKDITDASKLLARIHKALSPEKVTIRASDEETQAELTEGEKQMIEKALAELK